MQVNKIYHRYALMHTYYVRIKENAEALVVSIKEIRLEVNEDKTKYIVMARDQNLGRSHNS
jgi:protein subunit release factor A